MRDMIELIDGLAGDPLYVMSTAGQELFHTNFLYWLITSYPDECAPLWELFRVSVPPSTGGPDVMALDARREWNHLDLYVTTGMTGGVLALENKLHSIPRPDQLAEYTAKLGPPAVLLVTSCVLLSLLPPLESLPKPWWHVSYEDLGEAIRATENRLRPGFEATLVGRYADLVDQLADVRAAFDPVVDLDGPVALDPAIPVRLREARLLPLVEKIRTSRLAWLVRERIGAEARVSTNMSHSTGQVMHWVEGPAGRFFGWQLQAGQFRLVVITAEEDPKPRAARESLVDREYSDYFDFADGGGLLLDAKVGRKSWLGYEPNFVYRYRVLAPGVTWRECADLCAGFSERAGRYVAALGARHTATEHAQN